MTFNRNTTFSLLGVTIWILAVLFFLYEFFLRVFVGTLAHQIIPDLGLTVATFTLIGMSYHIAYGIMQVPVGLLVDRFGVKLILSFAILTCAFSTFLFASASNIWLAFFSRFFMGFASSFAFVSLLVIIATWFNHKYFGFLIGFSQLIGTMGPILAGGPLVRVLVASNESWRSILNDIGIIGLILFLCVFLIVKNKPARYNQNIIILKPKSNISILETLKSLMRNRQAWFIAIYSATVYVPLSIMGTTWGTSFLEEQAFSQTDAASLISTLWIGYAFGCMGIGFFSDKLHRRKSLLVFCSCIGIVVTFGILYFNPQAKWIYQILFVGLGLAASGQNIGFAAMAEHVSPSVRASALGLNNAFIALFNAIVQLGIGMIIEILSAKHGHHPLIQDYAIGFTVIPALYLLSLIISTLFIGETYCKPKKEIILLRQRLAIATN